MKTCGRAAFCWALLCLAACAAAAPRRFYCERSDVAWRAYRAPAAFEARVQSLAKDSATVKVKRVLRRQGHWPREDSVISLKLPPQDPLECSGRFEVPLINRRNYIVFAERRDHAAVALGPPLQRTGKLLRRIHAVYKPGYSECLVISVLVRSLASAARVQRPHAHMELGRRSWITFREHH
ncbi:uncharacterized protein ACR2FA_010029 [Aphomia sociella]